MTTIVTRAGKGSSLSWNEVDANFNNLNNDKLETSTVGVSIQPYSANLTEFATINPTTAGLALLDDIDAAAQRTTIGLGNVDNTSDVTKNAATATLTNKTITSPKIKAGQFGDSGTATNNFTITAESADGTMKLARGNAGATTQDIMTVAADGKVAFPPMAQTWQVVTRSRAFGTTYTNNTGQGIVVRIRVSLPSSTTTLQCVTQGVTIMGATIATSNAGCETWTIPDGATYVVSYQAGSGGTVTWQELR
jgi:hypothetical protein